MPDSQILVVEDDADNMRIASAVLTGDGYEVIPAENARTALDALDHSHPALILLDLALPGMSGFEAARRIRRRPDGRDVPIVAFTALALRGDEERARAAGCDDYLSKPCRPQDLRDRVRRWAVRA